jgi:hypothetical protein
MTVPAILTYSVLQTIAALILFAGVFIALLLSVTICLLIGRLVYLGADWVRVKASRWDHYSMLDPYVMTLRVGAVRQPLFGWWSKPQTRR